ncbi:transmembrane protein 40 [Cricetulus griseus]
MEVALGHWGKLTKVCFHPGADHGELEVLRDDLQLYGGNCWSPGFEEENHEGRVGRTRVESHDRKTPRQTDEVVRPQQSRWDPGALYCNYDGSRTVSLLY